MLSKGQARSGESASAVFECLRDTHRLALSLAIQPWIGMFDGQVERLQSHGWKVLQVEGETEVGTCLIGGLDNVHVGSVRHRKGRKVLGRTELQFGLRAGSIHEATEAIEVGGAQSRMIALQRPAKFAQHAVRPSAVAGTLQRKFNEQIATACGVEDVGVQEDYGNATQGQAGGFSSQGPIDGSAS